MSFGYQAADDVTTPYVTFAKETPQIGDWVVAIGNPSRLGDAVTACVI